MAAGLLALLLGASTSWAEQAFGKHGAVASASAEASQAALEILKRGGTAADAAVTAALVLSVVEPQSSGIGGGGFALIYDAKKKEVRCLDFRERAPILSHAKLFFRDGVPMPELAQVGALAVGVPGQIAGLQALHDKYGKRPMPELYEAAINLATKGFTVGSRLGQAFEARASLLSRFESTKTAWMHSGSFPQSGDKWLQPDLARTLRTLQTRGAAAFYSGEISKKIAKTVVNNGGILAQVDLNEYQVKWFEPISTTYRGYQVYSMPPPSSGGVHLLEMLNIMESVDPQTLGYRSPQLIHYSIEAMRRAYADRATYLGDPAFVSVPVAGLIEKSYAARLFSSISPTAATPSTQVQPGGPRGASEPSHTSHLSVVDGDGNAVVLTTTVNGQFGSFLVAEGTGIVLNNQMDDFAVAPGVANQFGLVGNEANAVAPRKTPLSSMTPTFIFKDNQLRFGLGSPGGGTIITTVYWAAINLMDFQTDLYTAIAAPRVHEQWQPDKVMIERFGFDALTLKSLRDLGHNLDIEAPWGNAQGVAILPDGHRAAASDPRGEGGARAY